MSLLQEYWKPSWTDKKYFLWLSFILCHLYFSKFNFDFDADAEWMQTQIVVYLFYAPYSLHFTYEVFITVYIYSFSECGFEDLK